MQKKRDKSSLAFKRSLAEALEQHTQPEQIGMSKKSVKRLQRPTFGLYKRRKAFAGKEAVLAFYEKQALPNPCKGVSKKQLAASTPDLYRQFRLETNVQVSLRTFQRLKPKHVASVRHLKFRQCLCEVCENPRMKLKRLNMIMGEKVSGLKELLEECVCPFEGDVPQRKCIDGDCPECGVTKVKERLERNLNGRLNDMICWQRWEHVKEDGKVRMDRLKKKGV